MQHITLLFVVLLLLASAGCSNNEDAVSDGTPNDLTRSAVCLIDGMILADHPGPKGQAIFKDGKHHYFCDTKGLFSSLFDPNYKVKIKQAFVQDFGQREWGSYNDRWIDAESAFYVMDSKKFGAMGPTLVSFSKRADADSFVAEFGGTVVTFSEITEELFEEYQARIRQQLRDAVGTGIPPDHTTATSHNH